jgi:ferredoxin
VYAHKVEEICTAVRKAVHFPLGVKLQLIPLLTNTTPLKVLAKTEVDYVVFSGGLPGGAPGIDLNRLEPEIPCSLGVSGSYVAKHMMFSGLLKAGDIIDRLPVSASGGCQTWQDIAETILYGATAVSIHTLFMKKGFGIIKSLKEGLIKFMEEKGFETIEEMRGTIRSKLLTEEECFRVYGFPKEGLAVSFDEEKCNGCGTCEETCFSYAIKMADNIPIIDQEKCEVCRVCVCNCPTGALTLDSTPILRTMARH